jgi:predicted ATPase
VELFSRRAVQAGIEISPQNRAAVASVCVQLDKLPLAIELGAAGLARLGRDRPPAAALAELLARLETGHASLDGTSPDGARPEDTRSAEPGRHGTMRAAIGWSHELSPRRNACCGPGCRCSPARSACGTPRTCAPATSCPPRLSRSA